MSDQNTPVSPAMTNDQLMAEILRLKADNAALLVRKAKGPLKTTPLADGLSATVSAKGAISIYGFGKWPVTLYKSQFERLIKVVPAIEGFIAANAANLKEKAVK